MESKESSNLKQLLYFYTINKNKNLKEIVDYYIPSSDYIYCLFNEIFKFYGDNVYKFGNSSDPDKRLKCFTTCYIQPCELIKISNICFDKSFAETLLFYFLKNYRMVGNREFFKCDMNIINSAFDYVNNFFKKYNSKKLLIEHLLQNNIYLDYYSIGNTKLNVNIKDITKNNICKILKININNYNTDNNNIDNDNIDNDNIDNNNNTDNYNNDADDNIDNDNSDSDNNDTFVATLTEYIVKMDFPEFNTLYKNSYKKFQQYKFILDKINSLFILEQNLKINRFMINDISDANLNKIKTWLTQNIEILFLIFKNNKTKNNTIKSINYKIDCIINLNYLQKFIAKCYNNVVKNIIKVESKQIRVGADIQRKYLFKNNINTT